MIGQTVSHYKILQRLGGGGMGVVYRAQDLKLQRIVALKFLPSELTNEPRFKERFIQEARAASALQHNNICTIHDIDESEEHVLFIVMDYYDGVTLRKRIERGPLSIQEATDITVQLAEGLKKAHEGGIIHRDIKPANVIMTKDGVAKILDFGLAKLVGAARITRTGSTAGTMAYMSPEQVQGSEVDHRTDIWSLGVVLYEMLSGQLPFKSEYEPAVMYHILNEPHTPIASLRPDVPTDIAEVVEQCLQKDPVARPQSAEKVLELLGKPSSKATPSMWISGRRRSLMLGAVATLFLAAAVFVLWSLFGKNRLSLEQTDYLVLADFHNGTSDVVLNHSLTEAMQVSLRQSNQVRVLARERVVQARKLLTIPDSLPLNEPVALAVAKREGARAVLAGSVERLGTFYNLICKIIDAKTGELVALRRQSAARIEEVLPAMDRLCNEVRADLGESMAQISKASKRLDQVTTSSLDALEIYARAGEFSRKGKYAEAAVLLEQAVARDSLFAMAVSDLSYAYRKSGSDSLAVYYHYRVLPLVNRVSDNERPVLLELYYGPSFEMEYQKAYEIIKEGVTRNPYDPEALSALGHIAMFVGDTRTALDANKKAGELDPGNAGTCYNNSGYALAHDQRVDEALEYYKKSKEIRQDYYDIDTYMAKAHWIAGRLDSCERILLRTLPLADARQSNLIRTQLASLYYFQGRMRLAREVCLAAIRSTENMKKPDQESYLYYLLAEISFEQGQLKEYRSELRRSTELTISPYFELALAGISYARHGLRSDAEQIIGRIRAIVTKDPFFVNRRTGYLNVIEGEGELASDHPEKAKELFGLVERRRNGDVMYWLAQLGLARTMVTTKDTSALSIYTSILSRRGELVMASLSSVRQSGFWTSWLWPEVQLQLGEFYFALGNATKAKQEITAALEWWKNSDGSFAKAKHAQTLLSNLDKGR